MRTVSAEEHRCGEADREVSLGHLKGGAWSLYILGERKKGRTALSARGVSDRGGWVGWGQSHPSLFARGDERWCTGEMAQRGALRKGPPERWPAGKNARPTPAAGGRRQTGNPPHERGVQSLCALGLLLSAVAIADPVQNTPLDQAVVQKYEARATVVTGKVTRTRDDQPWALSSGERVPIQQVITTGPDGYAHFDVAGGGTFDVFANSRVVFRQNAASAGDLLDVIEGRARIHLKPQPGQPQQRILTPLAWIAAVQEATVSVAIDEDGTMRIDVLEGEVRVQHTLLPRSEPTIVRAVDAILVRSDQQISRRLDRGSLYRYAVKLHNLWSAVTPGHASKSADPIEGNKFLAKALPGERPLQ